MTRRRTISKGQSGILIGLFTMLMLVCGAIIGITGLDLGTVIPAASTDTQDLPPTSVLNTPIRGETDSFTSTPPVIEGTSTAASNSWWQVYFTDPVNHHDPANISGSIEEELIKRIDAARVSIHIASFEFDLDPVAQALIAAKTRGVDVRWVTDDENGLLADEEPGRGQFAMLTNAGIEVRDDLGRSAFMHNKFWIFDGEVVWTGSTNITKSGIFDQNNNVIVIESRELAAIYESEFEEMWNGQFGPRSPSNLPAQSLTVNGTPILIIFTPEDSALENVIIPFVQGAESSVRFLAFSFTDYPLAAAMIDRKNNGLDVAGVFESFGSTSEAAELRTLFCAGVPVRQDGNGGFLHDKVIVIDQRYVITGSLNFSTRAEETNDENVIILDDPDIARLYLEEFDRIWSIGKDPKPSAMNCQP